MNSKLINYIDEIKNVMITGGFLKEEAEKYTINFRELDSMVYHNTPIDWYYKIIENKHSNLESLSYHLYRNYNNRYMVKQSTLLGCFNCNKIYQISKNYNEETIKCKYCHCEDKITCNNVLIKNLDHYNKKGGDNWFKELVNECFIFWTFNAKYKLLKEYWYNNIIY